MRGSTNGDRRTRERVQKTRFPELRLAFEDIEGVRHTFTALIVDCSDEGLGIQLHAALKPGTVVTLKPGTGDSGDLRFASRARVCWCRQGPPGQFRAGLEFEQSTRPNVGAAPRTADADYYEILQVNPKAEPETIHRVYRLLAQRFHPDNPDSGDEDFFKTITRAYEALSDPARRASYDLQRAETLHERWRIFRTPQSARGTEAERSQRLGVLSALYSKRMLDARNPSMSLLELEDLLGVPKDHLEFTLWYLKERGYATRSDNSRFQITVSGVDHCESLEDRAASHAHAGESRLLPVASSRPR